MCKLNQIKRSPRVEIVDDERGCGNGIIITLRQGWSFDPLQDNRVAGGDTIAEAYTTLSAARRFSGPYTS